MQKKIWPAVALAAAVCVAARADVPDFPLDFAPTSTAMNAFGSAAAHRRADTLVSKMTLDEKLQFIHSEYAMSAVPGGGAGYIQGVPRLGIPDLNMVDSATAPAAHRRPARPSRQRSRLRQAGIAACLPISADRLR
jgi:beta-glucosidase